MSVHAAALTLVTVLLNLLAIYFVGRARMRHKVLAPATTGHPDFERAFRAHQNTLEQSLLFLPTLWLAAVYHPSWIVTVLGTAWLFGRFWYLFGYLAEARKRSMGFTLGLLALLGLLAMAGWGVMHALLKQAG
jgi:uncharacterized membrane protein YecN with MAPEG domain